MYRDYVAWFRDVSATRGFAPVRIEVGGPRESPTHLTRQDRRGQRSEARAEGVGCWELEVVRPGRYQVAVHVPESRPGTRLRLAIGGVSVERALEPDTSRQTLPAVSLRAGPARLEAWAENDAGKVGVLDVTVSRVGDD